MSRTGKSPRHNHVNNLQPLQRENDYIHGDRITAGYIHQLENLYFARTGLRNDSEKERRVANKMKIELIKPNPENPRVIKDEKYKKLVKSIQDFPEMLELRPIVIDENNVVLGGNMRLRALQELGYKEVPIVRASSLTEAQKKEFIIKDNIGYGEWNWDTLANDWDPNDLDEWGLDIPNFESTEDPEEAEPEDQSAWFLNIRCQNEAQCQELYEKFILQGLDVKIVT